MILYHFMKTATHLSIHTYNRPKPWYLTFLWCDGKYQHWLEWADVMVLWTNVILLQLRSTHPHLFAIALHYGVTLHVYIDSNHFFLKIHSHKNTRSSKLQFSKVPIFVSCPYQPPLFFPLRTRCTPNVSGFSSQPCSCSLIPKLVSSFCTLWSNLDTTLVKVRHLCRSGMLDCHLVTILTGNIL